MKHLNLFLFLFIATVSYSQHVPWKTGIFISGFYRDQGNINNPRFNKQFYIAPELTFGYKKYFEMGIGALYQEVNRKRIRQSSINNGTTQIDFREWDGIESRYAGIKYINRANIQLPKKLILILGLDAIAAIGNRNELSDPLFPQFLNGELIKYNSSKKIRSAGIYNYVGFSYAVNKKLCLSGYMDVINFSISNEIDKFDNSSEIHENAGSSGSFDNAFIIKLGISYKI